MKQRTGGALHSARALTQTPLYGEKPWGHSSLPLTAPSQLLPHFVDTELAGLQESAGGLRLMSTGAGLHTGGLTMRWRVLLMATVHLALTYPVRRDPWGGLQLPGMV
ncbi:hypothetical protein NDU88_005545 [Pleurodeles waltl]|uniref:Uncharacterized protein n=1 Tax=Pleurodeles waltl TaxID=8319 RepID=A0AAV7WBR6_PLEWA|nr:hypothetical protein NDU88_005545 [Pleurodeles waltl]